MMMISIIVSCFLLWPLQTSALWHSLTSLIRYWWSSDNHDNLWMITMTRSRHGDLNARDVSCATVIRLWATARLINYTLNFGQVGTCSHNNTEQIQASSITSQWVTNITISTHLQKRTVKVSHVDFLSITFSSAILVNRWWWWWWWQWWWQWWWLAQS